MADEPLRADLDDAALAAALDAHTAAYFAGYGALPGAAFRDDGGVQRLVSGLPVDLFNVVVLARLAPAAADAAIAAALAEFRARGLPFVWHVGPTSAPADLPARLLAHGLAHYEDEPGMAADLSAAPPVAPAPAGLEIRRVADPAALRAWVELWVGPAPAPVVEACAFAMGGVPHGPRADRELLLGLLGGRPVAIAELFVGAGVASVQHVVTAPDARRRGIGAALTGAVLAAARARGYRHVVLTASPAGFGVYARLGFRPFCTVRRYVPAPQPAAG